MTLLLKGSSRCTPASTEFASSGRLSFNEALFVYGNLYRVNQPLLGLQQCHSFAIVGTQADGDYNSSLSVHDTSISRLIFGSISLHGCTFFGTHVCSCNATCHSHPATELLGSTVSSSILFGYAVYVFCKRSGVIFSMDQLVDGISTCYSDQYPPCYIYWCC